MSLEEIEAVVNNGSAYINRCLVDKKTSNHAHNFVEIAYVAEGEGVHIINGVEYKTSKGDIFLINYDISHAFIPQESSLLVYNCIFTPTYFNSALGESRNFFDITDHFLLSNMYINMPTDYIFVTAHGSENNHILNIYERMIHEFDKKQIGYRDIMRGYVIELLVMICRMKLRVDSDKTRKMLEILAYINEHYRENLKIEELAALTGYSDSHFRRVFRSMTNKTFSLYLQTLRVEEACRMLGESGKSVEQIAYEVGYRDIKHFYAVFKKISGKLPKEFR